MAGSMLHQGVWVLVCDGRKSLLLKNEGDRIYPKLATSEVREHSDKPTHMLGSDVPGRTFSGRNGRHAAVEPQDMQAHDEEVFLKSVAESMNQKISSGEIAKLVVVAPPRALATLRKALSPATRAIVSSEIHKDLVRLPLYEIEKHLGPSASE